MNIIQRRSTPISHDEARQIARRFCNSHFNRGADKARISIPADVNRDDDLLMDQYIDEQCAMSARIADLEAENARLTQDLADLKELAVKTEANFIADLMRANKEVERLTGELAEATRKQSEAEHDRDNALRATACEEARKHRHTFVPTDGYVITYNEVRRGKDYAMILHDHGGATCHKCIRTTLDELNRLHHAAAVYKAECEAWRVWFYGGGSEQAWRKVLTNHKASDAISPLAYALNPIAEPPSKEAENPQP